MKADFVVTPKGSVRFHYKGHMISLACDYSETIIWASEALDDTMFPVKTLATFQGTSLEAVFEAKQWIDNHV